MSDPVALLKAFKKEKEFFIGIDSDGCAFDSMEIKHKECFCPNFVNSYGLQPVSKFAREAWEFVNLYSKTRGCNRFLAVTTALDLLRQRKEVLDRNAKIPMLQGVRDWVERESKLGNPALARELENNPDPDLKIALEWSLGVNESVEQIVRNVPPYPFVRESLEKLSGKADAIVVSQTPLEALEREWAEHGIDAFVRMIAGQEMGTKTEHIRYAASEKYDKDKILMIGDAPGDMKAAKGNDALFYPINPGHEEASWKRFFDEGLSKFFAGTFKGSYEEGLIEEFNGYLPESPSW